MKVVVKGWLQGSLDEYSGKLRVEWWPFKEWTGSVMIQPHDIEADIPDDFDPRPGMVASIRKEIQTAREELAEKVMRWEDQISKLLAIEAPKDSHELAREDFNGDNLPF